MDYGHTAQNGQAAPQFGATPQGMNAMPNGQMQAMPNVSAQAAQSFGANTMNAYVPMQGQYPQEQMQYQGQPMDQYQMQYQGQPMGQYQMQQPMATNQQMAPERQMMYNQQVTIEQQMMPVQSMMQVQEQMMQPQMMQPQVTQQQVQPQNAQVANGNALESLKQGVDLNGGISASDVAKMDQAIQLLDQMGPAEFYEQFSTVAETTVGNNYGVKVDS